MKTYQDIALDADVFAELGWSIEQIEESSHQISRWLRRSATLFAASRADQLRRKMVNRPNISKVADDRSQELTYSTQAFRRRTSGGELSNAPT